MENENELKLLFWISTTGMLFLAVAFLYITLIYHKKIFNVKEKESQKLLQSILETEKKERKRISSDIHDSVSGDISAIGNYIAILHQNEKDPENKDIINDIKLAMKDLLNNVRYINFNLMPPSLENSGLVATLNDYFDRLEKFNSVSIISHYDQKDLPINSSDAYEIFRITQEILSNMIKHGKAKHLEFKILNKSNHIEIHISDDGHVFDFYENLKSSTGMGLKNIVSRVNHIEANLEQIPVNMGNKIIIQLKDK